MKWGMICHMAAGAREFGANPIKPHFRKNWEFYAVIRGRIGPVIPEKDAPETGERRLWVFPPGSRHGWTGDGSGIASIVVFHSNSVPAPLDEIVRAGRGYHQTDLSGEEALRVATIEKELRQYYGRYDRTSALHFERALLELSLLALKNVPARELRPLPVSPADKVEAAMAWFSEHLHEHPKFPEVSRAIHVSASQLRRLFVQECGENPQAVFTRLKLERAMHLMLADPEDKLETVAALCGFAGAANFCRVFKSRMKCSPDVWRRQQAPKH